MTDAVETNDGTCLTPNLRIHRYRIRIRFLSFFNTDITNTDFGKQIQNRTGIHLWEYTEFNTGYNTNFTAGFELIP